MTNRRLFRKYKLAGDFSDLQKLARSEIRDLQRQVLEDQNFKRYAKKETPFYIFQNQIEGLQAETAPLFSRMADIYESLKADEALRKTESGKATFERVREIYKFFKDFNKYMKLVVEAVDGLPLMIPKIFRGKDEEEEGAGSEFEGEEGTTKKDVKALFMNWLSSIGVAPFEQVWFPQPGDTSEERIAKLEKTLSKLTEAYARGGIDKKQYSEAEARIKAKNDLKKMGFEIERVAGNKVLVKTAASSLEGLIELGKQVEELESKYLPKIRDTYEELALAWEDEKFAKNLRRLNKLMKGTGGGVGFFEMFGEIFADNVGAKIRDFMGKAGKMPAEVQEALKEERPTEEEGKEERKDLITETDASEVETLKKQLNDILNKILKAKPERSEDVEKIKAKFENLEKAVEERRREVAVLRGLSRFAQHPLIEEIKTVIDEAKTLAEEEGIDIEKAEEKVTEKLDTKLDDMLAEVGDQFKNTVNDQISAVSRILEGLRQKNIEFDEDKVISYLEEPANKFRVNFFKGVDESIQKLIKDDEKQRKFFQGDKTVQEEVQNEILNKASETWESLESELANSIMKGIGQETEAIASIRNLSIFAQEEQQEQQLDQQPDQDQQQSQQENSSQEQINSFIKDYLNMDYMEKILEDAFQRTIDKNREEIKGLIESEKELAQASSVLINSFKRRLTHLS